MLLLITAEVVNSKAITAILINSYILLQILAAGVTVSVIVILMILIVAGIIIGCIHKHVRWGY